MKTWEELDSRPTPEWFDQSKIGIFVHWGIYSVPAYAPKRSEVDSTGQAYSEWYCEQVANRYPPFYNFHKKNYGENFSYKDFAVQWKAELFDPERWMTLFEKAGAKYFVLVSKHHDAFCLWPSYYSHNWNSVEIGPHRDLVGELMEAADRHGIRRGLYYSLLEWDHPALVEKDVSRYALDKMIPQMKELVTAYRPNLLFTDGEWIAPSEAWHSREFLSWLFEESCVRNEIVVNDRWGSDTRGVHGGYLTSEYGEVNSGAISEEDALNNFNRTKWEENRSIGASFGFNRNETLNEYLTRKELLDLLIHVMSHGGNLCLNVGPCADGTISPIIEERLLQLGAWLDINGEAVYGSKRGDDFADTDEYAATRKPGAIYLMVRKPLDKPIVIQHEDVRKIVSGEILGTSQKLSFTAEGDVLTIQPLPRPLYDDLFLPYVCKMGL